MFVRLLVAFFLIILAVQSTSINNSKGQNAYNLKLQKPESPDYDYDPTDPSILEGNIEGSGGAANLDDEDYDDEEELSRISTKMSSTTRSIIITTTTTSTTTTTTVPTTRSTTTTRRLTTIVKTTTPFVVPWLKNVNQYESRGGKIRSTTTTTLSMIMDPDVDEFKDNQEEYPDELEDDAYYNEATVTTKSSTTATTTSMATTRYIIATTRQSSLGSHSTPLWALFKFLTKPPIAAGILAGKNCAIEL